MPTELNKAVPPSGGPAPASSSPQPGSPSSGQGDVEKLKNDARAAGQQAAESGRQAVDAARDQVRDQGHRLKEEASDAYRTAKREATEQARRLSERVKEQSASFFQSQQGRVAEELAKLGRITRDTAQRLDDENDPTIAHYARGAADLLDDAQSYLRDQDLSTLTRDLGNLTRRRPEWVLGGMFVAGLAISRFLKASADRENHAYAGEGYDAPADRSRYGGSGGSEQRGLVTNAPPTYATGMPNTGTTATSNQADSYGSTTGGLAGQGASSTTSSPSSPASTRPKEV